MSLGSVLNQAGAGSYTRDQILTDATKTAYGLTEAATPDDVFNNILLRFLASKRNAGIITVTVKTPGGSPLSGVAITNVTDVNGNNVVTNETGSATGFIPVGTSSYSISNYADIVNVSDSQTVATGGIYTGTLTAIPRNFLRITSTSNWRFSANVTRVDVSAGGGGAGGGYISSAYKGSSFYISAKAGGSGGFAVIQEQVDFVPNVLYQAIIGEGGAQGSSGQPSSFLGVIAQGGNPPTADPYSRPQWTAGTGNGIGSVQLNTNGTNGTQQIYSSFTETSLFGGGGGFGGTVGGIYPESDGGHPGGGNGGRASQNMDNPTGGSGLSNTGGGVGGGGDGYTVAASTNIDYQLVSGSGGSGLITCRMHLIHTA